MNMEELIHLVHLKTKLHLLAFLCVSKSTHPNILKDSSIVALLCIMCDAALFWQPTPYRNSVIKNRLY